MAIPEPRLFPSWRRVNPDDEAARLAEARKAASRNWRVRVPVRPDEFEAVARVILIWPQPIAGGALDGWKVAILNADTGDAITTVIRLMVCSDAEGVVWARARMLVNSRGAPILGDPLAGGPDGIQVGADGEAAAGDFDLWVAEMRIAEADAS